MSPRCGFEWVVIVISNQAPFLVHKWLADKARHWCFEGIQLNSVVDPARRSSDQDCSHLFGCLTAAQVSWRAASVTLRPY